MTHRDIADVHRERGFIDFAAESVPVAMPRAIDQPEALPELLDTTGEDAIALEFSARHGENWRYVAGWSRWMSWTGATWRHEETWLVYDLARASVSRLRGRSASACGPLDRVRTEAGRGDRPSRG